MVYLDLLLNQLYLGTHQDGNNIDPFKDNNKRWHISGSLGTAAKPRIRMLLERMSAIKDACGEAKVVCGLPMPLYIVEWCCNNKLHLENIQEEETGEIHEAVRGNSKSCLLWAFPGGTFLDPLLAFMARMKTQRWPVSPALEESPSGRKVTPSA